MLELRVSVIYKEDGVGQKRLPNQSINIIRATGIVGPILLKTIMVVIE
jgi:hypothetical protein